MERPVVLTVAGSDSAGMAGLHMDSRTQQALGVHSAAALTATTAQNASGVHAVNPVPAAALESQLRAAAALRPAVVKSGLLCDAAQARALAALVGEGGLALVCDPVLKSSSGDAFGAASLALELRDILLPHCTLLTPNLEEAARLSGLPGGGPEAVQAQARALVEAGAGAVLVTGGHGHETMARDYFHSPERSFWLSSPRVPGANSRGTGCALASAIAAALARAYALPDAVVVGKMAVNQGLRQGYAIAGAPGPLEITAFPELGEDLPFLHRGPDYQEATAFPDCGDAPLGLYPVVDRAEWLERLLPQGVSTIQLRVKDLRGNELSEEIRRAVALARHYECRLFINDHWELALEHGAYGVHLGQQDTETADIEGLRRAGLRLGISTHCHYEVAAAHALRPSYLACGPVYHTTTKDMPWIPHGLAGLRYWRQVLAGYPLVAIGGINAERIAPVAETGVDGVAMITAITLARDPQAATRGFLAMVR